MGLFQQFPFTNLHEMNLDWIIKALKDLGDHAVLSVNGETGDVVLYKSENIEFPEVTSATWRMVRTADGHTAGIMFQNGLLYVMYDDAAERVYTVDHPPAYPVTSVNGQTGAVETYKTAYNRLPAVSEQNTNFYRQIDKDGTPVDVGVQVDKNKIERMNGVNRYKVYDEGNTPDIVTSINGESGAVMIAIPFADVETDNVMFQDAATGHAWSLGRETMDGVASIQLETSATGAEVYLRFFTEDNPPVSYVRKLLTVDDIPSSSGVVSVNGLTGVVTLYGDTMPIESGDSTTTKEYVDNKDAHMAVIVTGNTSPVSLAKGHYIIIHNSTITGITDGLYETVTNIPANTPITSIDILPVNNGALNNLFDRLTGDVLGAGTYPYTQMQAMYSGAVADSSQSIYFTIPAVIIDGASISDFTISKLTVRGITGYLEHNRDTFTGYTITANIVPDVGIDVKIQAPTAWSVTNNTPVVVSFTGSITLI